MPVMDEFREEREAMKQKSFKEKFQYFVDYYKWHVIGGVLAVAFAVSLIHSIVTHKDYAFYYAFLNTYQTPASETFREDFAAQAGIDLEKYEVMLDTDLYITDNVYDENNVGTVERLMVYIAAGDIDVMAGDVNSMNRYTYNGTFMDLRQLLPEELQAVLEPYYYYMDGAVADEINEHQEIGEIDYVPQYPANPSDPESMTDPIPVGLYIQDCARIQESFIFKESEAVMCIVANAEDPNTVLEYIRFVFDLEN
ncbi:MAG: hypothetical protein J6B43_04595 [Lachnospiraceae bacterium]|nr:hypothetical protein [Lachnospiraceae bacterium]